MNHKTTEFIFETHYTSDSRIMCCQELHAEKITRTMMSSFVVFSVTAVVALPPLIALVLRISLQNVILEWWPAFVIVVCCLLAAHVLATVRIIRRFPRTIGLSDNGLLIQKASVSKTFSLKACRWWVGVLREDSELQIGERDVPALIIEVRLEMAAKRKFACVLKDNAMPSWVDRLNKSMDWKRGPTLFEGQCDGVDDV